MSDHLTVDGLHSLGQGSLIDHDPVKSVKTVLSTGDINDCDTALMTTINGEADAFATTGALKNGTNVKVEDKDPTRSEMRHDMLFVIRYRSPDQNLPHNTTL